MKNNLFAFKRLLTPQFIYPISLFAVFFVLYIQSFNFRLGDQFYYANDIETGQAIRWAEPGHLFYRPLGWLIYEFFQIFGYTGRALTILQLESAFFGAIGVSTFFYLAYNVLKDTRAALFSASILAFSHSYWAYSGNGSAYVPCTSIMIFAFVLLFKLQEFSEYRQKLLYVLAISLISALSALFWLPQVLCFPAIVLGIILMPQQLNYRKRFVLAFIYLFGILLFLITPLLLSLIFVNGYKSFGELVIALTTHSCPIILSFLNFFRIFYGVAIAFVAIPDMGSAVRGLISGDFKIAGTNLILESVKFLGVWTVCLLTISYLIVKWKTIELKASSGDLLLTNRSIRTVLLILGVWIFPFFCFGIIWYGADLERFLPALPAAILVISISISHINTSRQLYKPELIKAIFIAILVLLSTCNFSGFLMPERSIANDKDWKIAKSLGQKMNPEDLVITWGHDMAGIGKFLFYYSHRLCIDLNMDVVLNGSMGWNERLARAIKNSRANGGKVFIHYRLITEKDVPESRWTEKEHPHPNRQELRTFFSQYRKIFFCIIEGEVFWEIIK